MKVMLSIIVAICMTAFISLSVLPGSVTRTHFAGLGGVNGVLVPAGDDNGGGH